MTDALDRMDALRQRSSYGDYVISVKQLSDGGCQKTLREYTILACGNNAALVKIAKIAANEVPHYSKIRRYCPEECPRCQIDKLLETLK